MTDVSQNAEGHDAPKREHWGSKLGVILAVAGSAVGLGNFLRFPGQAVNNGGGAFMVPYIISFLILGIPICWCEWTMGRLGGRFGQNNGPGVMYSLWRRGPAKAIGAMTLFIPVVVYMYYVFIEAWCLYYAYHFFKGTFAATFASAVEGIDPANQGEVVDAVVGASGAFFGNAVSSEKNGGILSSGSMLWMVLICFVVNFAIIYRGVTRGIETFCKIAMPLLIGCAVIILIRALTLDGISKGLGFMWNPDWAALKNPQVWLAASGQIFFTLSVGFGLILCYSSYLRENDDVVLTSLSASSTNEFCEVVLGGMIVVPTAFLFLGASAASQGTFGLGFVTMPSIMYFMPGGNFFGGMWFGLLFLAAVTSSLSMLQPAIAFLEDGFGLRRSGSVLMLGVITAIGALGPLYYTRKLIGLDHTDFWCNFMMIIAATCQVLLFGWIIGAERGCREMNRGADFNVPRFMPVMIRWITPGFLIVILGSWAYMNAPGYLRGMSPTIQGSQAARSVYAGAIGDHFSDEGLSEEMLGVRVDEIVGASADPESLPGWLEDRRVEADAARTVAEEDASVARSVFILLAIFYLSLLVLSDIACRNRIGKTIAKAEAAGVALGD